MYYRFMRCYSLTAIPDMDTSKVTNMSSMFNYCSSLTAIPRLDISKLDSGPGFSNCYSLQSLHFDPTAVNWAGCDVSLKDCSLGHQAIVSLFNSLPAITSQKELALTGNPGVSMLTEDEKAIAVEKGWTLTL